MKEYDMDNRELENKYKKLLNVIHNFKSAIIAYSGGVDSTLVLKASKDALGKKVLAVCATSPTYTQNEIEEAKRMSYKLNAEFKLIETDELDNEKFVNNAPDRCYFCKNELYSQLKDISNAYDYKAIFDGSNLDDLKDYRPGRKASSEYNIVSPLIEAGINKKEVRQISYWLGLPTWNKPALACLASRFPYGVYIEKEELNKVAQAELYIQKKGIKEVRARNYKNMARIEISQSDLKKFCEVKFRSDIINKFKELGFSEVLLDLEGYRSGSLNDVLNKFRNQSERILQ